MRFDTGYNRIDLTEEERAVFRETPKGASITIPDDALDINEIIERARAGIPASMKKLGTKMLSVEDLVNKGIIPPPAGWPTTFNINGLTEDQVWQLLEHQPEERPQDIFEYIDNLVEQQEKALRYVHSQAGAEPPRSSGDGLAVENSAANPLMRKKQVVDDTESAQFPLDVTVRTDTETENEVS